MKQGQSQIQKADNKMIKFAHIYVNSNNLKYIEAANSILLTIQQISFAADALYHKCCFYNFRSPWCASNKSTNNESKQNNSYDYTQLYTVVRIGRASHNKQMYLYKMSQLCSFYQNITKIKIRA